MKKSALTSLVIFSLCALAYAGPERMEMKQTVAPAPVCPINWTGFYLGLHAGYGWGDGNIDVTPLPDAATFFDLAPTRFEPDMDGFVGGGQFGFNWQFGHFVMGIETDLTWTDLESHGVVSPIIDTTGAPFGAGSILDVHQDINWMGTTRLRLGFTPCCNLLLYATGGVAYGDVDFSGNADFRPVGTNQYPASFSETTCGWTVGGGAEWAIDNHWSFKVEYLYRDLGDESVTVDSSPLSPPFQVRYDWETQVHTVTAGINFKF